MNGEEREVATGTTVVELLRELGLRSERVAVERNGRIVRKEEHGKVVLAEGDRVEVVTLVGGG